MSDNVVKKLEEALRELSSYEKRGLDTSSLKIFIKNLKDYLKVTGQVLDKPQATKEKTFDEKLNIIQSFLEDTKAFPTIKDVIDFANVNLDLDFKNQKESREITINRIISRIRSKPELKETLKTAVFLLRNEKVHNARPRMKRDIISAETFSKWAEIIKNI